MKAVDLHVHSTYSDGTDTPSEIVSKALSKGLKAIALTDHDTVDGIPEIMEYAKEYFLIEIICLLPIWNIKITIIK